mmetsp:Transcript_11305/g.32650  ORF Transcript_11305/g.32650 Transcript_11305/m.32650 type:complete len:652 (-) Transcript_11305:99-2054(-)
MAAEQTNDTSGSDGAAGTMRDRYRTPWGPVGIVLVVELCERMTYYTIAGSQKFYLNKRLGYTASSAAAINSIFSMLCYLWCLPGGLIADMVGRYKVIVVLASSYAVGTFLVAISTSSNMQTELSGLFFFGALGLIPMGTGGIKPNICNFGADQIGDETDSQREAQRKFFSFFYVSINVGVMISFGYLANVTTHGIPGLVPLEQGYFVAYIVAAVSMAFAVGFFIAGTRCYTLLPGGGIDGFKAMSSSIWHSATAGSGCRARLALVGWLSMPVFLACTVMAALWPPEAEAALPVHSAAHVFPNHFEEACGIPDSTDVARRLTGGTAVGGGAVRTALSEVALILGCVSCICLVVAHSNNDWIQPLRRQMAEFSTEDVRQGFAAVPLIIVVNLSYSMAYNAMNNAMPSQACQMNTMFGGAQLNGAFFNLADAIAIVLLTPLFENVAFPLIEHVKGSPVRLGQKICTGLLIAAGANAVAAWMEVRRRASPLMCWEAVSECAPNGIHMRDMSAFWMFVPFGLIGASEILVNPCIYYYAYTAAPPKVRSLVQAFNLFFQGSVSNAFTSAVMSSAFPDDLDTGSLVTYYEINVVCALAGIFFYFCLTRYVGRQGALKGDMQSQDSSEDSAVETSTGSADGAANSSADARIELPLAAAA